MSTTKENNVFQPLKIAGRTLAFVVPLLLLPIVHRVGAQQQPSARTELPSLGVFDRWVATRWKEYHPDSGMIDVTFSRPDARRVLVRVSSGGAPMGEGVFRFEAPGHGRYCDIRDGAEHCDAAFTYDSVSMNYLPDDPKKRTYRAVLIKPDIFVHYEEIEGVQFDVESYAAAAFDSDAELRKRAVASVERRRLASAEVKRRRGASGGSTMFLVR